MHGTIHILHTDDGNAQISVALNKKANLETNEIYSWSIHEFPTDFTESHEERCKAEKFGTEIVNISNIIGNLHIPENQSSTFNFEYPILGLWF